MTRLEFIVSGAPRTKKNSPRIVGSTKGGRPIPKLLPSAAFVEWNKLAQIRLIPVRQEIWRRGYSEGLAIEVNCRALFYRDAEWGDACGFYQALADALEEAQVVKDDKWIRSWDGSRLLKDAANPRIEVVLEVTGVRQDSLL